MSRAHWTDETDREADVLFRTFSDAEIRRRQDLAGQQLARASALYDRNPGWYGIAVANLQRMQDALTREMLRRTEDQEESP